MRSVIVTQTDDKSCHTIGHTGVHHSLADGKCAGNRNQNIPRNIFGILTGGENIGPRMIIVVMQTKKNISSLISGNISLVAGSSPTVAPTIISTSKISANQRFFFPEVSGSLPLVSSTNTEDSPQVGINVSSAITTSVSPSRSTTSSR